jgi:hypothetical protein
VAHRQLGLEASQRRGSSAPPKQTWSGSPPSRRRRDADPRDMVVTPRRCRWDGLRAPLRNPAVQEAWWVGGAGVHGGGWCCWGRGGGRDDGELTYLRSLSLSPTCARSSLGTCLTFFFFSQTTGILLQVQISLNLTSLEK